MSRRSLFLWCVIMSVALPLTSFAQDAMWNAAKRMKRGLDATTSTLPIQTEGAATMNPLSPPNTPDVQVFNPSQFWQSENSIAVNYSNENQLMVSTNGQIPGSNPVVQQPWAFSTDGGLTWPAALQSESIPPGILDCFGDPVASFDRSGRAYYCTLGSPGGIFFVSTTDFGQTWSARSDADPNHSTSDDKQHAAADFSGTYPNNVYVAWTDFNVSGSPVVFNRSTDKGATWGTRQTLQVGANRGQGVHIAIGPNGEVYVIWAHYTTGTAEVGIGMAKSTDGGATFGTPTVIYPINGIRISNGGIAELNNVRASSFPYADVDRSNGPRRGWVYTVHPELVSGQADIFLHRSTDGGATWSSGIQINGPDVQAGKWQFMASIGVDPSNGNISVSYYSMDSTGANFMTNRYMAYSVDGGDTWDNFVISDVRALWAAQLTPNTNTTYNGDYYETVALNGKAWACWTDRRLGPTGQSNRAYVQRVLYAENFGWVRGTVTNTNGGAPVSNVNIDFVQSVQQQGASSNGSGFYLVGAQIDTPGTTANLTLRARKFGFRDTTIPVTVTRFDTLTRNFGINPAAGGTLTVHAFRNDNSGIAAAVKVIFQSVEVVTGNTDSTTGNFSTPLPEGAYTVIVDPAPPYGNRTFTPVNIVANQTTTVQSLLRYVIEPSPTTVRDTLAVGQIHAKTLVLTNTTADSVPYRITDEEALARGIIRSIGVQPPEYPIPAVQKPKGAPDTEHGDSPLGSGGPDGFGYRWIDSDEPGGPQYAWVDISGVGTSLTLSDDTNLGPFPIGFSFPFYGNSYDMVRVCSNGWLSFTSTSTAYSNEAIPSAAEPNNAVYPFWDDLNPSLGGTVHYYYDAANSQFIVQYTAIQHFGGGGTYTFEAILRPNGDIVAQYQSMVGTLNSNTVGIENADGSVALQVVFNNTYIHDSLAVKYYLPNAPWISENPFVGVIPPNSDQNITVTFDANNLTPGTNYNANISVDGTHPDIAGTTIVVPAILRVQSVTDPLISVRPLSIAFPLTGLGDVSRDTITARNVGNQNLVISSISNTNTDFSVSPTSGTIVPGDSLKIAVTYTPTFPAGIDTGRVIILSNSTGSTRVDVPLTGNSVGVAHFTVQPDTFYFARNAGQDTTFQMMKIKNTGTDTLHYQISEGLTTATMSAAAVERSKEQQESYTLPKDAIDPRPGQSSPLGSGGPDAFGYRWIDSDEPGGPQFNWIDITAVGTALTMTDDNNQGPFPLGFTFPFYGTDYNEIRVCSNGWLSFTSTSTAYSNVAIPATAEPNNAVYPFWDDLNPTLGGTIHYYFDAANAQFIVQYTDVQHYTGAGETGLYTFEAIIKPNGEIKYQYLSISGQDSSNTIGVENSDGTIALQVVFNSHYVHNNLAVLITKDIVPWLSVNQPTGTIVAGDSTNVQVRVHPAGLMPATYNALLNVTGNTPDMVDVGVRLDVTGTDTTVTVTSPNGGETWLRGTSHAISWNRSNPVIDSVKLEYSVSGPAGPWRLITSATPAKPRTIIHPKLLVKYEEGGVFDEIYGTYNWMIPDTVAPTTNAYVRVSWSSNPSVLDISNGAFTITDVQAETTWTVQTSGISTTLRGVRVIDQNTAWAAGASGAVIRTTNGGATWTSVGGGPIGANEIYTMDAISASTAFVSTSPSATFIFRTTDGGTSWQQVYTLAGGFIDGIRMADANNGLAMGDPVGGTWLVLATTDGGATWTRISTEPTPNTGTEAGWNNSFYTMNNNQNAWFGTNNNGIWRTTDGGATWSFSTTSLAGNANCFAIQFNGPPSGTGLAAGQTGGVDRSSNGGANWSPATAAGTGAAFGMTGNANLSGSPEYWLASSSGSVYYSSDHGTSWTTAGPNGYSSTVQLWHVDMKNIGGNLYGWAVGDAGKVVRYRRIPTGVETTPQEIPDVFALDQNYPNPFNPSTTIQFQLPEQSTVSLKVYNILGQEVMTLADGVREAGYYKAVWDGHNTFGSAVASGVYFYRFEATGASGTTFTSFKKALFLK